MADRAPNPKPKSRGIEHDSAIVRWALRGYKDYLTQAGRWLLWPSGFFLFIGAISLEFQHFMLACYLLGVWAVAFGAVLVWRPKVLLATRHAERVRAGVTFPVEAEVEAVGRLAGRDLRVSPLTLPPHIACEPPDGVPLPILRRGERATVRLGLNCERRGVYSLQGFRVETDFPFGLLRTFRVFRKETSLVVYPRFTPLARLEFPGGRHYQPGGVALASYIGDATEYLGNRDFREGDNIRDIDWRATARLHTPIVREYREEYFLRAAVILDTHIARPRSLLRWFPTLQGLARSQDARRDDFERAVSVCAAVADHMARENYIVDLFAAGPNLYHLTAGRSLAYLDQILDILACVDESPVEPFDTLAPELAVCLPRLSAVFCVFLDWTESRRAFAEEVRRHGVGVKIVVVNRGRCTLDPRQQSGFGPIAVLDGTVPEAIEEL